MTAMWKMLALTTGLLTLGACAGTDAPAAPDEGADAYLFGLSRAELLSIQPLVGAEHAPEEWLAFNRAPFDCARYDDLCDLVGAPAAEELTRDALFLAVSGATREAILAEEARAIAAARAARPDGDTDGAPAAARDSSVAA